MPLIEKPRKATQFPLSPHHETSIATPQSLLIPLPASIDYLPDGAESTSDIPLHISPHLKLTYDTLESEVAQFFNARRPDLISYNFSPY
ncbi:Putative UDP-rhamnose:rhamnosyltransferase 1 [Linum perenne]